jgi:hypothetical protein
MNAHEWYNNDDAEQLNAHSEMLTNNKQVQ